LECSPSSARSTSRIVDRASDRCWQVWEQSDRYNQSSKPQKSCFTYDGTFENVTATWLRWCDANGNPIPTGDEIVAQKEAQISQAEAQLAQERSRTREALLFGIELGLKLKFGDEGLTAFEEISAIDDRNLLQAIASRLPTANTLDEIRQLYQ
jgi:hypothetical protein